MPTPSRAAREIAELIYDDWIGGVDDLAELIDAHPRVVELLNNCEPDEDDRCYCDDYMAAGPGPCSVCQRRAAVAPWRTGEGT